MTGFGSSQCELGGVNHKIELKAVNSKTLDLSIKMPSYCKAVELQIRATLSSALMRGKVELYISPGASSNEVSINEEVLQNYYTAIKNSAEKMGVKLGGETIIAGLMKLPEIMGNNTKKELGENEDKALIGAVSDAATALNAFREEEGKVLIQDILGHIDSIESLLENVKEVEGDRIERVRDRIQENLNKVGAEVDKGRFEAEIIYYLEKFDITEEKVRLAQHLNYFREVASAAENEVGRKLNFISQEIGREVNTLGSKSNSAQMQRYVVEMKDSLEKIKEQALNIL